MKRFFIAINVFIRKRQINVPDVRRFIIATFIVKSKIGPNISDIVRGSNKFDFLVCDINMAWYQKHLHTLSADDVGKQVIKLKPSDADCSFMDNIYTIVSVELKPAKFCICEIEADCCIDWPNCLLLRDRYVKSFEIREIGFRTTLRLKRSFENWAYVSDVGTEDGARTLCKRVRDSYEFCFAGNSEYFGAIWVMKQYLPQNIMVIITNLILETIVYGRKFRRNFQRNDYPGGNYLLNIGYLTNQWSTRRPMSY